MVLRFAKIFPTVFLAFLSTRTVACPDLFRGGPPSPQPEHNVIRYHPDSVVEVTATIDVAPDHSVVARFNDGPPETLFFHRLNGEDHLFLWPAGSEFHEGARPDHPKLISRMSFQIFKSQIRWEFYPDEATSSVWQNVLHQLDEVISNERSRGAISQELADFAISYHRKMAHKNLSYIALRQGEHVERTISVIHGGVGGGIFPGLYRENSSRTSVGPNRLQIEESFPGLVLAERERLGERAELYELVRLSSSSGTDALDQLLPVVARHLVQKNGLLLPVARHAGIYFLAPTRAHRRHYERFFGKTTIALEMVAEPEPGYAVYRIPLVDFLNHFLRVRFSSAP